MNALIESIDIDLFTKESVCSSVQVECGTYKLRLICVMRVFMLYFRMLISVS